MIKNTSVAQAKNIAVDADREFLLSKALAFSVLLNDTMSDRIYKEPHSEHERDIREGMIFLSYHIEDLLRSYFKPVAEAGEVANE